MTSSIHKRISSSLSLPAGVIEIMELFSVPASRSRDETSGRPGDSDVVAAYKRIQEFRDSKTAKDVFTKAELLKLDWALDCLWDAMSLAQKIEVSPYMDEPDQELHEDITA